MHQAPTVKSTYTLHSQRIRCLACQVPACNHTNGSRASAAPSLLGLLTTVFEGLFRSVCAGEVFALELLVQQTFLVCNCPELKTGMAMAVK